MAFVYRLPRVSGLEVDVRGVDGLLMGYVHVTSAILFWFGFRFGPDFLRV